MNTFPRMVLWALTGLLFPLQIASAQNHQITPWRHNYPGAVTVGFDDGDLSQVTNAVPLLNARGLKATFFIVTSDMQVPWDQWRQVAQQGHEIASHTVTHPDLTTLSDVNLRYELSQSQLAINQNIPSQSCISFAYPENTNNSHVQAVTSEYYISARAGWAQAEGGDLNFYEDPDPSWPVPSGISLGSYKAVNFYDVAGDNAPFTNPLSNIDDKLDFAIAHSAWYDMYFHDVPSDAYYINYFSTLLDDIVARNIWMATYGEVAKYMRERIASTLGVLSSDSSAIQLSLTNSLAGSIYNEPLTIRSIVPSAWLKVSITQGGSSTIVNSAVEGTDTVVYYDALPNGGTIVLTQVQGTQADFILAVSPASQTVIQGGSTSYGITVAPQAGFNGQVTLSVAGLPAGATASFTPNPATTSSTLAVATTANTPSGNYTLTITGVSGTLTHTATATLLVTVPPQPDFTLSGSPATQTVVQGSSTTYGVTVTSMSGFSGQVTLSVAGLPTGATGSFAPNPATTSSTLAVTTATNTPSGNYTLTITGVSGTLTHTATATLLVTVPPQPDFTLSGSPATQTVVQGNSTTYGVTVASMSGFGGQVTLSVAGLPTGATASFAPNPTTSSSTLAVTAAANAPTGTYTLTITGVSGSLTHTATVSLTVAPTGVTFDNKASSDIQFGVTSITTPAFVIGSGGNRAAMIMVAMNANTATNITAKLGGVTGTLCPGTDSGTAASMRTLIFQVINPPSGSQTATVSWTTTMNADVGVITVTGADQVTPCMNGVNTATNSASSATTSLTITSNVGDLTASIGYTGNQWQSPFTNQTLKWGIDSGEVGGDVGPGTGTTTHSWTDQYGFQPHAVSGANFKAVSGPPDFSLRGSPTSQTVVQGGSTNYGVTVAPTGGFSGQVTLSVAGLPTGATASFTPNPTTTSSTLAVTTAASTPAGGYTLTISGVSGALTHTATVTLVVTAPPDFAVSDSPVSQTIAQGGSTNYGVTITPIGGFNGQVTLSVDGLPSGATASFTPNPATTSSTLAVTAAANTPTGNYTLTITGVSGTLTHTATVTLVVNPTIDFSVSGSPASQTVVQGGSTNYGITVAPTGGFSGQVTLSVAGLPTGATASVTPNPTTTSSTLAVTTAANTPAGNYTLTITGVSGTLTHTATVTLIVNVPPDFSLSGSPASQTIAQGSSANYGITITPVGGFSSQVTLSVDGLPSGATASFTPNPATTSSTLAVTAAANTPTGTYTLTVTGVSGSLTHTTTITLVITVSPDFALAASPTSQTVTRGNATNYGVTITPSASFTSQVSLSVSGLPTGATGSFTPNPATTSSTLAVTTTTSTSAGTYTLTITGVGGGLTRTTTVTLTVNLPPDFSLAGSPTPQTVLQGSSANYGITITPLNSFNGQVSLSVAGLPTGATASFTPNPATTSSTLAVTTAVTTPAGSYTLTITGVSGSLTHTTTVTLVVNVPPDFSLSGTPATQTVIQGRSVTYTVTISPVGGFAGQVNLSVTGLPTGATATLSPNPATTTSSLSVATLASTPTGSYTLTITGVNGGLTHTATVTLTVARAGVIYDNKVSSGFNFGVTTITTPAFVVGSGTNRAAMIMVAMAANNATNITASLGGVPGVLIPGTDTGTAASIRTMIFQVINPPSGSQRATVSWTTSMHADVGVITVSGADPTRPCINGANIATTSASTAGTSLTITSNVGDLTATIGYTANKWKSPYTNRTLKWGPDGTAVGGDVGPGTGTTTHTWTDQYAFQAHAVSGANFKAAQ